MKTAVIDSDGVAHTRAVAAALAAVLEPGDVVLLVGDLGAGKTTFTQGLGAALGVSEQVTSPTFTLVRPYACGPGAPVATLLHADLYRLDHLREVIELALPEALEDDAVAVVEWGDVAMPVLGRDQIVVTIDPLDEPGTGAPCSEEPGTDAAAWRRRITVDVPDTPRWRAADLDAVVRRLTGARS
ncbi:MAG: tRNA (adenosine(37)-N6)-threonylcarbamoyltransferase complex ATPase subunit type 1 TsaE [Acidimicrobiales bacterium]